MTGPFRIPSFDVAIAIAIVLTGAVVPLAHPARAYEAWSLTGVPDYEWHAGCFGTATGNLMGYWDRHGFPDFYTGPTGGGLAPLDSFGRNSEIRALWASKAGVDGRPAHRPGHMDDYWVEYESTAPDPFVALRRAEHAPDCLGDFIGLNQLKWSDLAGESGGNIDGYSFNYFDPTGLARTNFIPPADPATDRGIPDLQSGLRAWTHFRGAEAVTVSQQSDFNPNNLFGRGFTFRDLVAEIDSGYPVLLHLQPFHEFSRVLDGVPRRNSSLHGMLAYGYLIDDEGQQFVRYRTSWASGDQQYSPWTAENWTPNQQLEFPLRGVVCYHPLPKILSFTRQSGRLRFRWQGPLSVRRDDLARTESPIHQYYLDRTSSLTRPNWEPLAGPLSVLDLDLSDSSPGAASFYRLRLETTAR